MFLLSLVVGFPAAAYFAAVAIPVAILFFSRRRSRIAEVPALSLWERIGRPVETHSFATLFKRLMSLLMQLLIVAGLVFALADPWPTRKAAQRMVIIMDVSATMQTRLVGGDRMDEAKRRAKAAIAALPPGGEVVLMLAGYTPELAVPPTGDAKAAIAAIDGVTARDVEGDVLATLRAAAAFADDPRTETIVFSDFAGESPETLRAGWSTAERLRLIAIGQDVPDVAVTDIKTELHVPSTRSDAASDAALPRLRVVALVAHRGMEGRTVPVRLLIDGSLADSQNVILTGPSTTVRFDGIAAPAGTRLELHVDGGDDLAADDVAFAVAPRSRADVYLVSAGNSSIERAIVAEGSVRLRVVRRDQFRADDAVGKIVIVNGAGVAPTDSKKALAEGYLFIATADPFGWSRPGGWAEIASVTHWLGDHPALIETDPSLLHIGRGLRLNWSGDQRVETLVAADVVPIIAERMPVPPGGHPSRCIYWMFDPEVPGIRRTATFPLLLWNTIDYLAGRTNEASDNAALTGRPLKFPSPGECQVLSPSGRPLATSAANATATVRETNEQGIYTCRTGGGSEELRAVNLLSSWGTRPLPRTAVDGDDEAVTQPAPSSGGIVHSLWRFGSAAWQIVVLALIAMGLVEWVLFHRRIVRIG